MKQQYSEQDAVIETAISSSSKIVKKTNRILALDLARGISIVLMILGHTVNNIAGDKVKESSFGSIINLLASSFAIGVFIFIMGAGITFSKQNNLLRNIQRGLKIFFLGYLLNLLRVVLPILMGMLSGALGVCYTWQKIVTILIEVDILQFAGLSLIILSVLKRYLNLKAVYFSLGILIVLLSPRLWGIKSGFSVVDFFLSFLWGDQEHLYFPLFSWISFSLFGAVFGLLIQRPRNRQTVFKLSALFGLLLSISGLILILRDPLFKEQNHFDDYLLELTPVPGFIWMIGIVLTGIALCHWITEKIPGNFIFSKLYYWSKHVTVVYFIQWIIIGWLSIEIDHLSFSSTIFTMGLIFIATDHLTMIWEKMKLKLTRQ